LDTAQKQFGSASLLFDGNDNCTIPDSPDWDLIQNGTDFTIDFWVKMNSHSGQEWFITQYEDGSNNWSIKHDHGFGLSFTVKSVGSNIIKLGEAGEITDNDWHHVAVTKSGNDYRMFLGGTSVANGTDSDQDTYTGSIYLGDEGGGGNGFDGWLDEIRIINGVALWTSNFTPPISEGKPADA